MTEKLHKIGTSVRWRCSLVDCFGVSSQLIIYPFISFIIKDNNFSLQIRTILGLLIML